MVAKIHEHPVVVTLGVCVASFGLAWYALDTIYDAKDEIHVARVGDLEKRLSEQESYEQRFQDESLKRNELDLRLAASKSRVETLGAELDELRSQRWQERFETQRIDLNGCREQLALLTAQHDAALMAHEEAAEKLNAELHDLRSSSIPTPLPSLNSLMEDYIALRQEYATLEQRYNGCLDLNKRLQNQLTVACQQNTALRTLVTGHGIPTQESGQKIQGLIVAVQGLSGPYRRDAILQGLQNLGMKIHGRDLAAMMEGMEPSVFRTEVIVGAAPYLIYPVPPDVVERLLQQMSGPFRKEAIQALTAEGKPLAAKQ